MLNELSIPAGLAWSAALVLAWVAGEFLHRWLAVPRISVYGVIGFAMGSSQLGLLPDDTEGTARIVANLAFGLILFEFGYRINLRWWRTNPWLALTGVLEAGLTFVAVYLVARWWGAPALTSLLLGSLSMATSPASVLRVINEQRSSGQVTERVLHLTALNCVLAVFTFKVIVGFWAFDTSGSLTHAMSSSVVVLVMSAALGTTFGVALPALLRRMHRLRQDATLAFAIGVILLVALTEAFKFSPVLATLTFGLVVRDRRVILSSAQRNFGALGDLLVVVLFAYTAATLEWPRVVDGFALGLLLVLTRLVTKVASVAALAHHSGMSLRKGVLTGLALTPISVFVILTLEHTRYLGIDLLDQLAPLGRGHADPGTDRPHRAAGRVGQGRRSPRSEGILSMALEAFKTSASLTLGVELELQLVSLSDFDLVDSSPDMLELLGRKRFPGNVVPEITQSMIEIFTEIQTTHGGLLAQLREIRDALVAAGDMLNIGVCGGGTHPFQQWSDRKIFAKPRFREVSELYGYLAKQFTIFGQHAHVGCTSGDEALFLLHSLNRYVPHFIALSASSPFVQHNDTLFDSARLNSVFAFPLSGRAPFLLTWEAFERDFFSQMERTGVVKSMKDFYWDIRPKPEFGTIELRVCDTPLSVERAAALACYLQALCSYLLDRREAPPAESDYLVYNYNRFQACRFGLDGLLVHPKTYDTRSMREDILATTDLLAPHAAVCGATAALEHVRDAAVHGNDASFLRGRVEAQGGVEGIVHAAIGAFRGGRQHPR